MSLRPALPLIALAAFAAGAAHAGAPPPASVPAAAAPVNDDAAQDRIMALVRAGKCGQAKTEATRVGDLSLADQIGSMCGARSSDPFAKGGGGKGGRGSGGGESGGSGGGYGRGGRGG